MFGKDFRKPEKTGVRSGFFHGQTNLCGICRCHAECGSHGDAFFGTPSSRLFEGQSNGDAVWWIFWKSPDVQYP